MIDLLCSLNFLKGFPYLSVFSDLPFWLFLTFPQSDPPPSHIYKILMLFETCGKMMQLVMWFCPKNLNFFSWPPLKILVTTGCKLNNSVAGGYGIEYFLNYWWPQNEQFHWLSCFLRHIRAMLDWDTQFVLKFSSSLTLEIPLFLDLPSNPLNTPQLLSL